MHTAEPQHYSEKARTFNLQLQISLSITSAFKKNRLNFQQLMAIWFFSILLLFAGGKSQPTNPINQTDLQVAMDDMRAWSYHGFVILLKILNGTPNSLSDRDITFLMPKDDQLSKFALSLDHLQDFILSHSIPTGLLLSHLLHFPNGTLVPSSVPNRMLSITNNGKTGLFVNNARIVTPNVCLNSVIRCHGISAAIAFDNADDYSLTPPGINLDDPEIVVSANTHKRAKSSSLHVKSPHVLH